MENPLLQTRKGRITYIIVWLVFMTVDAVVFSYVGKFKPSVSVGESLVMDSLLALMCLIVWFPVYFTDLDKHNFIHALLHHIGSGTVIVLLWLGSSNLILVSLFSQIDGYQLYIKNTFLWRSAAGVTVYTLMVLIYYLLIYMKNYREQQLRESELKSLVKESELSSLKSQINPHFLFNSLNSISSLTMVMPEKAQEMIIKLSEYLRYSLAQNKEKLVPLKEELENVNRYLDIEKIRFGKKLGVDIQIKEECNDLKVPGLILQPLLENCIKYGVYETLDQSKIKIRSDCDSEYLILHIMNDYDPDAVTKKGEGIGLKNIRSRLKIIYGSDSLLFTKQLKRTFEVRLLIPIK